MAFNGSALRAGLIIVAMAGGPALANEKSPEARACFLKPDVACLTRVSVDLLAEMPANEKRESALVSAWNWLQEPLAADGADADFRKFLEINKSSARPELAAERALLQSRSLEDAKRAVSPLPANPERVTLLCQAAQKHANRDRIELATHLLRACREGASGLAPTERRIAGSALMYAAIRVGDFDTARPFIDEVARDDDKYAVLGRIAVAYSLAWQGRRDEALSLARRVKLDLTDDAVPSFAKIQAARLFAFLEDETYLARLMPSRSEARYDLGDYLLAVAEAGARTEDANAIETILTSVKKLDSSHRYYASAWRHVAIYVQLGKLDRARAEAEDALFQALENTGEGDPLAERLPDVVHAYQMLTIKPRKRP